MCAARRGQCRRHGYEAAHTEGVGRRAPRRCTNEAHRHDDHRADDPVLTGRFGDADPGLASPGHHRDVRQSPHAARRV